MKAGTLYAARLKRAYAKLRQSVPEPAIPEPDDPIRRLATAILGVECGDAEADRAIDRIFTTMVDWNEVRVSSAEQVYRAMGDRIPQGLDRAQRLTDALQAIYHREHRISLDRLKSIGRREARDYLEALEGVGDYAAAAVMLWSFGGHAIPVSEALSHQIAERARAETKAEIDKLQSSLTRKEKELQEREREVR